MYSSSFGNGAVVIFHEDAHLSVGKAGKWPSERWPSVVALNYVMLLSDI